MGTYTSESLVETQLGGLTIDSSSVPTSTELATIITEEEAEITSRYETSDINSNVLQKIATYMVAVRVLEIKAALEGGFIDLEKGPWSALYKSMKAYLEDVQSRLALSEDFEKGGAEIIHVDRLEDD